MKPKSLKDMPTPAPRAPLWPRITAPDCKIGMPDIARGVAVIIVPACPDIDNLKVGMEIVGGNAAGLTRDKNPIISDIESINATDRASGVRITVSCISTNTDKVMCDLVFAELPEPYVKNHFLTTRDEGGLFVKLNDQVHAAIADPDLWKKEINVKADCISIDSMPVYGPDGKTNVGTGIGHHGAEGGLMCRQGSGTDPCISGGVEHQFYLDWVQDAKGHFNLVFYIDESQIFKYVFDETEEWPQEINNTTTSGQYAKFIATQVLNDIALEWAFGPMGLTYGVVTQEVAAWQVAANGFRYIPTWFSIQTKIFNTIIPDAGGIVDSIAGIFNKGLPHPTDVSGSFSREAQLDVKLGIDQAMGETGFYSIQQLARTAAGGEDYSYDKYWGGENRIGRVNIDGNLWSYGGIACQAGMGGLMSGHKWSTDWIPPKHEAGAGTPQIGALRFWIDDQCVAYLGIPNLENPDFHFSNTR